MGEHSHGDGRQRQSFTELHNRLDSLDKSLMKLLEGRNKQSATSQSVFPERQRLLPDLPDSEARAKESVMERISLLEHRVAQLRLGIEASKSSSSTTCSIGNPSTSLNPGSKQPFPTRNKQEIVPAQHKDNQQIVLGKPFRNKNNSKCEIEEEDESTSHQQEKDGKNLTGTQQKKIKSKPGKSWRCKRLLGC
ncbi:uncharacterized protein LOC121994539 [Zingiber officinale]|uniref:uncharacterized protein LOC121994539 n=1 Tax=Zingiber officinale TaxID=94328 RepID=UPI001C4BE660|nr:uncharacterized protein LOC121994539 [Zingiber officinale]